MLYVTSNITMSFLVISFCSLRARTVRGSICQLYLRTRILRGSNTCGRGIPRTLNLKIRTPLDGTFVSLYFLRFMNKAVIINRRCAEVAVWFCYMVTSVCWLYWLQRCVPMSATTGPAKQYDIFSTENMLKYVHNAYYVTFAVFIVVLCFIPSYIMDICLVRSLCKGC